MNLVPGSGEGSRGSGGLLHVPVLLVDLLIVETIKAYMEPRECPSPLISYSLFLCYGWFFP